MKGTYGGAAMKVTMQDKWGDVNFYLMPFVKPSNVKIHYRIYQKNRRKSQRL